MADRQSIYDDVVANVEFPECARGPAEVVQPSSIEMQRDEGSAYTNENLHRRIDNHTPNGDSEKHVRKYGLGVYSNRSIRNIETITHYEVNDGSEDAIRSEESEIP